MEQSISTQIQIKPGLAGARNARAPLLSIAIAG